METKIICRENRLKYFIVSDSQITTVLGIISFIDYEDLKVWTGIINAKKTNVFLSLGRNFCLPGTLTFFTDPEDSPTMSSPQK